MGSTHTLTLRKTAVHIVLFFLICLVGMGKAAPAVDPPLTSDDVRLLLIGGAEPAKMVALIEQRGIDFALTPELEKKLRDDGADASVINALRKAKDKAAPSPAATAAPPGHAPAATPASKDDSSSHPWSASDREKAEASATAGPQPPATASTPPAAATDSSASTVAPRGGDEPVLHRRSASTQSQISPSGSASSPSPASAQVNGPVLKTRPGATEPSAPPPPTAKPAGVALKDPSPDEVQKIIHEFAAKEKTFQEARNNYTYHQANKVETLDGDGNIDGVYEQEWDILFEDSGKRIERVTYAPLDTLKRIQMTSEDLDAFRNIQPFVLTSDELPEYEVKYLGHVKVDEITAYVFSVRPKEIEKGRQYFQGVVWVDDRDLQIVKSEGKNVPEQKTKHGENLFPRFTTYREQIDGKYWFPTFTMADDTLYFSAESVHVKEIVRYSDYKQFKSRTRIISVTAADQPESKPATPPKPK